MILIKAQKSNRQGSIVFEVALSLLVLLFSIGVNLELIRRVYFDSVFQQGAFLWARDRGLGLSRGQSLKRLNQFLEKAFESDYAKKLSRALEVTDKFQEGVNAKLYLRYTSFFRFLERKNQMKHHFEITKVCYFPF